MQNKNASPYGDILFLAVGELVASLVITAVYYLLGYFEWRVITGCLIGSAITVLNFLVLSVSINRAIDRVMAGQNDSLSEEEAEVFAAAHSAEVQKSVRASYLIRQIVMIAVLVVTFVLKLGSVLATLIPLLLFRPMLTVREMVRQKKAKT